MEILRTVAELSQFVDKQRSSGLSIGFVPTMGALHDGHISLIERAVSECPCVIASVFVNPTQFNNPEDLASYPRNEEADFLRLEKAGSAAVFAPSVEEMYPSGTACEENEIFDLGEAAQVMEGKFRPGHFQGVAQVVSRLFRFVKPDKAFFGEKDFQQIAVIRNMVRQLAVQPEIIACPIRRAADGLALSSRNALLTEGQREIAPGIHETLAYSREYAREHSVQATHDTVVERIDALPFCRVEYFEIVDGYTLRSVTDWDDSDYIVGCITVYCGKVRLIDNITYKSPETDTHAD